MVSPAARVGHAMAYDSESDRIVLFGGEGGFLGHSMFDTWAYDARDNTWQNMSPSVLPPPRLSPGMAYDSRADLVILFGGSAASHTYVLNDTWTYDLNENTWTEMTPQVSPPARLGTQMVYDAQLDKVILFGGVTAYERAAFNDTWTYDLGSNTWTQVGTAASPSKRGMPVMAYDVESDRVVLFSGSPSGLATSADNQTWTYDARNETWTEMSPGTSPALRLNAAGAYDARADRLLIFGGETGTGNLAFDNDTWAYDLNANAWGRINAASAPSDRLSAMAYDAKCDRTVLFGGTGTPYTGPYYRDTWIFDHGNSTWTMVLGPLPPVAAFTTTPSAPIAGDTVRFDGSASSDADGTIVWFVWDFNDGSPLVGIETATFDHAFSSAGTYAVRLTVKDDEGLTTSVSHEVVVGPAPDTVKPILTVSSPADGVTLTSTTVTVAGTASDDVGVAKVEIRADNETWIVATGTTSWSATLTLAEGANTIYVRVTDTSGNVAMSVIHVTVPTAGLPTWIWVLVAVGIAAGAAAAYLVMRRRRKPAEREEVNQ